MTNGDRIRAMTDDELTRFLMAQIYDKDEDTDLLKQIRYHAIRNFLKAEVQEDERRD